MKASVLEVKREVKRGWNWLSREITRIMVKAHMYTIYHIAKQVQDSDEAQSTNIHCPVSVVCMQQLEGRKE